LLAADMRRRLSLILTLTAWLLATGGQWDVVQAFGWGRMIVTYSQSMPLLRAVEQTFRGDTLCGVCVAVQSAKEQQPPAGAKAATTPAPEKIFLANAARVRVFASAVFTCTGTVPDLPAPTSAERSAPPGPPPRRLA
jgi:hypothetical protein